MLPKWIGEARKRLLETPISTGRLAVLDHPLHCGFLSLRQFTSEFLIVL